VGTGDKLVNNFRILKELGKGSYADVYLCEDVESTEKYAMKIMARPEKKYKNEIEEIAIMKSLKHECIVNLHEVIDDKDSRKIYLIQEFVEGVLLLQ
jgi:serine/threonine protein kinase